MGVLSNRVSREELQAGDHVYSWRFAYSYAHHGIYVGDGKVIHFTRGQGQELGTGTVLDNVLSNCFLCGYPLYRFEYGENTAVFLFKARGGTCTLALADASEVVLHRAKYLLENGFGGYHIFRKNCEDFAMYCKTGLLIVDGNSIGTSGQASSFLGAPLAAVASSPLRFIMAEPWGLVAVSASMYCLSRYVADLGNRRDVTKVAVEDLVAQVIPEALVTPLRIEEMERKEK
ncbi:hypothetical protein GOP47_0008349 [Adiantum capillus-veneris]|uniref:LRAT domain-containing protein n=1 Tax=Adiantum capillus-veneris TaxID=13818 RepID=A0A9D4ZI36_ADICA|nr:hypothetical protein GOP47_0008349 [Adiantum capillus-veneris]